MGEGVLVGWFSTSEYNRRGGFRYKSLSGADEVLVTEATISSEQISPLSNAPDLRCVGLVSDCLGSSPPPSYGMGKMPVTCNLAPLVLAYTERVENDIMEQYTQRLFEGSSV